MKFRGEIPPLEQTISALRIGLLLAVAVIFLLLWANFQSMRLALAIVLTIPAVLCGVLLIVAGVRLALRNLHIGMLDAPSIPVGPTYFAAPLGVFVFTLWLLYDIPRIRKGKSDLFTGEE